MIAIVVILSGCSGRDHRVLDDCRVDRGRSDRISKKPQRSGGRREAAFLDREECEHRSQGKKVGDSRCGKTIEAQPVFDQTCQIEAALAAPGCSSRMDHDDGVVDHRL
ncbi:hypothetical protein G6L28_22330 [Agrobacterium larrymoorei]|uniref:hypothetical protein n=1 Tax=Agrobacterium larrymoorei TaxID=160699 RepID=UPI00157246C3|nr:hypothetical protein [Agrobacterium larrymoorei]NTJ45308.1 hypothetical protein [Agrobacterium larrymoorei]